MDAMAGVAAQIQNGGPDGPGELIRQIKDARHEGAKRGDVSESAYELSQFLIWHLAGIQEAATETREQGHVRHLPTAARGKGAAQRAREQGDGDE